MPQQSTIIPATSGKQAPTPRDKLNHMGDKLDAMCARGGIDWTAQAAEYLTLATQRALAARPPRIKITTTASFWQALAMKSAAYARVASIKADLEDQHSPRVTADLTAAHDVAVRDWQILSDAIKKYEAHKRKRKEFWQRMRAAERNTVNSSGLSFPVVVQFGRRS